MHGQRLQKAFASAALLFLPYDALNFDISVTYGDVLLIAAVALNVSELTRIHSFQIPILLALPFFLISGLLDPDGQLKTILQILYIWGFVLPFGWAAFTNLTTTRIAQIILLSAAISSALAIGQGMQLLPPIGHQEVIEHGSSFSRGAGLSLNCNSLVMGLTPTILLLPHLGRTSLRSAAFLVLIGGMVASVSKSVLLAIPGILVFLWRDPKRKLLCFFLIIAGLTGAVTLQRSRSVNEIWLNLQEMVERRAENADVSISNRSELIGITMDYVTECPIVGYGAVGTQRLIGRYTDNTVHVYYLGLILTGGLTGAVLLTLGFLEILWGLGRAGAFSMACYLAAHLLACVVLTVVLISSQSVPVVVAGAVLVRRRRQLMQVQCRTATSSRFAGSLAYPRQSVSSNFEKPAS